VIPRVGRGAQWHLAPQLPYVLGRVFHCGSDSSGCPYSIDAGKCFVVLPEKFQLWTRPQWFIIW